jgi:hypothetical protein
MDSVALLLTVMVLFVLWLILVGLTTHNFGVKRHVHRHGFHFGRRH